MFRSNRTALLKNMYLTAKALIGLVLVVTTSGQWIFPDQVQFNLSDVLNKKCGASPYTDRFKPEDGRMFENPWLIMFRHPEESDSFCQGTLITDRHVLTTAICAETIVLKETIVILGEYDRASALDCDSRELCDEYPITERLVERLVTHPKFINDSYENDIAVATLNQELTFSNTIRPICLPLTPIIPDRIHEPIAYNTLWAEESSRPKQIQMKYISHVTCMKFTQGLLTLHEGQICAKYEMNVDASLIGGSGSPLVIEHHDHVFQLGILSIGLPEATYRDPYVYVNVSTHVKWVHDTIQNDDIDLQ